MELISETPVEHYDYKGWKYQVKREDLCTQAPGPPFSKIRGLMPALIELKSKGIKHVGYVETSVSMAGWGVAWACRLLGIEAVIYNPVYKTAPPILEYHREKWKEAGATIVDIKAGMAKVNYNICRNTHRDKYGSDGFVLPLGLPFPETISETAREAIFTLIHRVCGTVVVNIGSGTICAGLMRAVEFRKIKLIGVMGRSGSIEKKKKVLQKKSGVMIGGLTGLPMSVIDPGWEYTERSDFECPFPCHPYYDRKAFQWMIENRKKLRSPVLFWNIGSMPDNIK